MPRSEMRITPKVMGRVKRRGPMDPGLKTVIPSSVATRGTWECPQTTSWAS